MKEPFRLLFDLIERNNNDKYSAEGGITKPDLENS